MNANAPQQVKAQGINATVKAAQDLYNQGNREWVETDEETLEHFLNVLPPIYGRGCFACSEPWKFDNQGRDVYIWLRNFNNKFEARYATAEEMK